MAEHIFLQTNQIEVADLHEVLDLTATGRLEWGRDHSAHAIGANVDFSLGKKTARDLNLLEVRAGFTRSTAFKYLRMTDAERQHHYVEDGSEDELLHLARRVLKIGKIAVSTTGGRLYGTVEDCDVCERPTGHLELYSAPYGLEGAMMAGSERKECVCCGDTVAAQ